MGSEVNPIRCLHPVPVRNKYTGDVIMSPCGKCDACITNKAGHMSLLCSLEESDNAYCYFVTLTYSDEFLPKLYPVESKDENGFPCFDLYQFTERLDNYSFLVDTVQCSSSIMYKTLYKVHPFDDSIPYCEWSDLTKFIKRLRRKIDYNYNEKIRYYAVSEYGPKHFRPHFHLLLFFDDKRISEKIGLYIREAWKYGLTDCSLAR